MNQRLPDRLRRMMLLAFACSSTAASAQTTVTGSALALRSTGSLSGTDVVLSSNGYLGTYITLAAPGAVSFDMQASGVSSPHMNLVVDDSKIGFDVGSSFGTYSSSLSLPAGTHFVRLEYNNDTPTDALRALTLRNLKVTGATVSNASTNANALAASDTYIANYRRGNATVNLTGPGGIRLLGGQSIHVDLARNAFNFGTAVPGTSSTGVNNYLGSGSTTLQTQYQARLKQNFNAIVPENAGKWAYNEATRDVNTMTAVDQMLTFAQNNNLRTRMHNLIWGDNSNNGQQPSWVLNNNAAPSNGLLDKAYLGDATAKADLRTEITERIAYYVGTGVSTDRAKKYVELDVYNESYHTGAGAPSTPTDLRHNYWNVYGATGVADIYRETKAAIASSGATARVFMNEYNVLDDGSYANYFVQNVEAVRNAGIAAGYGDVVQGIGSQYYPSPGTHSANKVVANIQNLAVQGLPIALTEFGVQSSLTTADGATILGEMLRLTYGNADTTGFMMWGFHQESGTGATTLFAPQAALYTVNTADFNTWTLTDAGKKWQDQLGIADWDGNTANGWTTHVTPTVGADGSISFNGYYGDYNLGGQTFAMNLAKGTSQYAVSLAAPPDWFFWKPTDSGSWNTGSHWTGTLLNAIGTTAHFGAAGAARTLTVDSPVTVGQMNFISAATYTIGGTGPITLDVNGANDARINVLQGAHTVSTNVIANDSLTVRVDASAVFSITGDLTPATNNLSLVKSGAGTFNLKSVQFASMAINDGTLRTTSGTSLTRSLAVGTTGSLDITGTAWVVDYGESSASPLASIRGAIVAARGSGAWNGASGINSAMLVGAPALGIGYAEAAGMNLASFGGVGVDATAVLFRVTLLGDANLDGTVNFDDLLRLAQSYESPGTAHVWSEGDGNYDGVVDFADLLLVAQNYDAGFLSHLAPGLDSDFRHDWELARALVPEPVSGCILLAAVLTRRSRRGGA